MNHAEWDRYESAIYPEPQIWGRDFEPPSEGMLLLCRGYNINGGPYLRVWLRFDGMIGRQFNDGDIQFAWSWSTSDLYPSKRAIREDTTLRFALLMRERHEYPLTFTAWRD